MPNPRIGELSDMELAVRLEEERVLFARAMESSLISGAETFLTLTKFAALFNQTVLEAVKRLADK